MSSTKYKTTMLFFTGHNNISIVNCYLPDTVSMLFFLEVSIKMYEPLTQVQATMKMQDTHTLVTLKLVVAKKFNI